MIDRIVIDNVRPQTPDRSHQPKGVEGLPVQVRADIFRDGHDRIGARVRWRPVGVRAWNDVRMNELSNDVWAAMFVPESRGAHEFVIEAWTDRIMSWHHDLDAKRSAGIDWSVEREEGALLLEESVRRVQRTDRDALRAAAQATRAGDPPSGEQLDAWFGGVPDVDSTRSKRLPLWVDRERAQFGAWYELFPRSEGGFKGTIERVQSLADSGFDVLYLPPVHPIGHTARKGRDNSPQALPDDVGSPWAIGTEDGDHTAVHPDLGTLADFDRLVDSAREAGMEIALDYALQCSPDHPWVTEHPEWFHHRPDGSIKYAENPPKRYEDTYPINFWPSRPSDRMALWEACAEILDFWIGHGVHIFRVDNPHTKPLPFWEWLIRRVRERDPDVILLAEAFTRPKMMAKLAEVGFSQSYTYFTWRGSRDDLRDYLAELTEGPTADYMRPNFWTNTPDILSGVLRGGPPSAFALRLVLAALMVPSYGIYSGYELFENEPVSPDNEEYLHSEKYELKQRGWDAPPPLMSLVSRLNSIRRRHRCFAELSNVRFHHTDNPALIAWSKQSGEDTMLMVVNLDPCNPQMDNLWVDLGGLGMRDDVELRAYDELGDVEYRWRGSRPFVRLDPAVAPAHAFRLEEFHG